MLDRGTSSWRTKALVDTGSSLTLFDRGAGEALGVDFFDQNAERRLVDIAGQRREVQGEYVTLTLPPFSDLFWDTQVWFFIDQWNIPFGILGNEGFLDQWAVSFVRYDNYFVVEPIDEFTKRLPKGVDPFEEFQKLDADWDPPS